MADVAPKPVVPPDDAQAATDEPTPKRRGRPPGSTNRRANTAVIERTMNELFGGISMAFALGGDQHCARVMANGGPQMARAWAELAAVNPGVRAILLKMNQGSAWGGVFISTTMVGLPIAQHHGLYPASAPNPWAGLSQAPRNGNGP